MTAALLGALLLALQAAAAPGKPPKPSAAPALSEGSPLPVHAPSTAPVTMELVRRRFEELDARTQSMRARFRQTVGHSGSDARQQIEGEILFKRPQLMRLTYSLPAGQTVVSDGEWLWVHRAETNQVVKTKLESWRRNEPLARNMVNFGRTAELLTEYDASLSTVSAPGPDGHRAFELLIRPKAEQLKAGGADYRLTLRSSTRDFFPAEAALDMDAWTVRSVFLDPRINPELPPDVFRFAPPKGAEIFEAPQDKP